MRNEFTESEEREYYEVLRERQLEKERQMREDAMDCISDEDNDEN